MKRGALAAIFRSARPGDWPRIFLVGERDSPADGDMKVWVAQFRAWDRDGRSWFVQWCIDGGIAERNKVLLALRCRAARDGIARVELFSLRPPPSLESLRAVDLFNQLMQAEKAQFPASASKPPGKEAGG